MVKENNDVISKDTLEEIGSFFDKHSLTELEYGLPNGAYVIIKKKVENVILQSSIQPSMPTMQSMSSAQNIPQQSAESSSVSVSSSEKVFKSPMIGVVYLSSSPSTDPFISIGSKVKKGDSIFIIEAMKVMNEIKSTFDGTIKNILVKNGSVVEFGQILVEFE
jgi:acetyl-CoA carboxylase biotin carboxyl carrier protein